MTGRPALRWTQYRVLFSSSIVYFIEDYKPKSKASNFYVGPFKASSSYEATGKRFLKSYDAVNVRQRKVIRCQICVKQDTDE